MRIAFIVHDYHRRGGHSRYVYELATRFAREHEVHVFATVIEGERDPRIKFHYIPSLRFSETAGVLTFILPATFQFLKRFDIVHAQGLCGLRQNVTTCHMCQPAWYDALKTAMGELTFKERTVQRLVQPLEKYIFQPARSKQVIAVSKLTRRNLDEYYGRKTNVTVIYHGVDLAGFHPDNRLRWRAEMRKKHDLGNDKFVVLYVGYLSKGALPAIETIARLDGARLVLVSATDPTPYMAFAEKFEVSSRVHFLPLSTTIERYYAMADAFLFPTVYDPFGMVVSEAMATGLPVITSSNAGAAELIDHGLNGFVVEPAWNVTALTSSLAQLRDDPALRERMGQEARAKIEHFTWEDTAVETMRVYEMAAGAK
ncbi:MAG TPA: glycosyltransferase family 4 protein [Planctomycetota bacterium]|nr:glycosyltransferase family 4 protein [Planctomycetota bacterium]